MKKITVNTDKKYDIIIQKGILANCGGYIKPLCNANRVAIITDSNVAPLYLDKVRQSLMFEGYDVFEHIISAGEKSKNLDNIAQIYSLLADNHFSRSDIIVALGGGVVGDMAGFAASTYMRGIDFVQIPTTLLAQVDSSVGGKTGVDISQGKNLVGAFHQPILVLIDTQTLDTLPVRVRNDGMGEVIKYGCISSKKLFEFIEDNETFDNIERIIAECVTIKRDIVSRDERESGERKLLNFGHTFGHAIEKLNNYTGVTHGEAVAIGMVMAAKMGGKMGVCDEGIADRIALLCIKNHLPIGTNLDFEQIKQATLNDKKANGDFIDFVLLTKIGNSVVKKINVRDMTV